MKRKDILSGVLFGFLFMSYAVYEMLSILGVQEEELEFSQNSLENQPDIYRNVIWDNETYHVPTSKFDVEDVGHRQWGKPGYVFVGKKHMNMYPKTVNQSEVDFTNYFSNAKAVDINVVLLAGVMKCGTGTLKSFLREHPRIKQAVGLQVFFAYNFGIQWFLRRLPKCGEKEWAFSRCTNCFMIPGAPGLVENINQMTGKRLKLLFIIRNPVDRLISHYTQLYLEHNDLPPFMEWVKGLNPEDGGLKKGLYVNLFKIWFNLFGEENILILEHGEFVKTPWISMQRIERYLGLDPFFTENSFLLRKTGKYYCYKSKGPTMEECTHNPETKGRTHVNVTEQERAVLQEYFRPHNEQLFTFLNRRFDWN